MKKLLLLLSVLFCTNAWAGNYTAVFTSTTAATNEAGGGIAWTNVGLVTVKDTLPGTVSLLPGEISDYANAIKFASASLGFLYYPRTIVTGVLLEAHCQCDTSDSCQITDAQMVDNLTPQGSSDSSTKPLETSYKDSPIGGDGSMFGLTSAQIKTLSQSKNFGFRFWVAEIAGNSVVADCDGMRITIYYDVPKFLPLLGAGL